MIRGKNKPCHLDHVRPNQSLFLRNLKRDSRNLLKLSSQRRDSTIFISFLDSYLDGGVVGRAALGEEAERGVEPHHVVPLEPVLERPDQQRLVGVRVPPADRGQALAHGRHQGELAERNPINSRFICQKSGKLPGVQVFVDFLLEFSEDLLVDVEQHSDPEEQLIVVSVQMLPVTLIKEHFGVKFFLLGPRGSVRDGAAPSVL